MKGISDFLCQVSQSIHKGIKMRFSGFKCSSSRLNLTPYSLARVGGTGFDGGDATKIKTCYTVTKKSSNTRPDRLYLTDEAHLR